METNFVFRPMIALLASFVVYSYAIETASHGVLRVMGSTVRSVEKTLADAYHDAKEIQNILESYGDHVNDLEGIAQAINEVQNDITTDATMLKVFKALNQAAEKLLRDGHLHREKHKVAERVSNLTSTLLKVLQENTKDNKVKEVTRALGTILHAAEPRFIPTIKIVEGVSQLIIVMLDNEMHRR